MASPALAHILTLPRSERIRMVEDIWDSIANEQPSPDELPLTDAQQRELEARLAAYERDPQNRVSLDDAWEQIQRRTRRAE